MTCRVCGEERDLDNIYSLENTCSRECFIQIEMYRIFKQHAMDLWSSLNDDQKCLLWSMFDAGFLEDEPFISELEDIFVNPDE